MRLKSVPLANRPFDTIRHTRKRRGPSKPYTQRGSRRSRFLSSSERIQRVVQFVSGRTPDGASGLHGPRKVGSGSLFRSRTDSDRLSLRVRSTRACRACRPRSAASTATASCAVASPSSSRATSTPPTPAASTSPTVRSAPQTRSLPSSLQAPTHAMVVLRRAYVDPLLRPGGALGLRVSNPAL